MSKRKSIFGHSKDEIWGQIATDIGGEFIEVAFGARMSLFTNMVSGRFYLILTPFQPEQPLSYALGCAHRL